MNAPNTWLYDEMEANYAVASTRRDQTAISACVITRSNVVQLVPVRPMACIVVRTVSTVGKTIRSIHSSANLKTKSRRKLPEVA